MASRDADSTPEAPPYGRQIDADRIISIAWVDHQCPSCAQAAPLVRELADGRGSHYLYDPARDPAGLHCETGTFAPPSDPGSDFSTDEVLRYGSLPLVWTAPSKRDQLQAYVQLYLKEEIQAEAIVRNLPGLARFLPIAALFHGQILNVEGPARDAGVARSTVQGYLDILEDTPLVFRVPAFEGKLRVKQRRHPKLYWLDSGVARAARKHLHVPSPEERGSLFEGLVAQLLRARNALGPELYDELYYWAVGKAAVEVDFLLLRGNHFTAIEVKARERLDQTSFAGLKAIAELPQVTRRILVYFGDRRFRHEAGIEVLPLASFLEDLHRGLEPA